MGTSISAHIEVKKDGQWYHFGNPIVEQNYQLFALINGVRNDRFQILRPVAKINRLPDDMSFVTRACVEQNKPYVYSPCVLSSKDLEELQDRLYQLNPGVRRTGIDELDLEYSIFRHYVNGSSLADHPGWDDLRIIIWYDND